MVIKFSFRLFCLHIFSSRLSLFFLLLVSEIFLWAFFPHFTSTKKRVLELNIQLTACFFCFKSNVWNKIEFTSNVLHFNESKRHDMWVNWSRNLSSFHQKRCKNERNWVAAVVNRRYWRKRNQITSCWVHSRCCDSTFLGFRDERKLLLCWMRHISMQARFGFNSCYNSIIQ